MGLVVNPWLLMVTLVVFMMTPTSHSICVARHHNSTTPSSSSPPPPPTQEHRQPPPKTNTAASPETTLFKPTTGSPPQDDLSGGIFSRSTHNVDQRLKRICDGTDYPSLCLSSLSPSLSSSGKSLNIRTALGVAIKAASQHARLGAAALARLAKAPGAVEDSRDGLGVCEDSYTDALDSLRAAVEATARKDVGTANSMLSAVVTDSVNCGDALKGTEAGETMTKYNDKLRMLASNCLAIASFIN